MNDIVFAKGFLTSLGATPFSSSLFFTNSDNLDAMLSLVIYLAQFPCKLALIISNGWVIAVEIIPDASPDTKVFKP